MDKAIFINRCCGDGMKFFKEWRLKNPDIKVEQVGLLNAHEQKLGLKYGFDLNDLYKHSFIYHNGELLKGDN